MLTYILRRLDRPWWTRQQLAELRQQRGWHAAANVAPYVRVSDGDGHTTVDACLFDDVPEAALRLRSLSCDAREALAICSIIRDELMDRGLLSA